jgi:hypothetical protein
MMFYHCNRPWKPIGLSDVEAPIFFWVTDEGKVVILTLRPLFNLQEDSWYSFLLEAESTAGT